MPRPPPPLSSLSTPQRKSIPQVRLRTPANHGREGRRRAICAPICPTRTTFPARYRHVLANRAPRIIRLALGRPELPGNTGWFKTSPSNTGRFKKSPEQYRLVQSVPGGKTGWLKALPPATQSRQEGRKWSFVPRGRPPPTNSLRAKSRNVRIKKNNAERRADRSAQPTSPTPRHPSTQTHSRPLPASSRPTPSRAGVVPSPLPPR